MALPLEDENNPSFIVRDEALTRAASVGQDTLCALEAISETAAELCQVVPRGVAGFVSTWVDVVAQAMILDEDDVGCERLAAFHKVVSFFLRLKCGVRRRAFCLPYTVVVRAAVSCFVGKARVLGRRARKRNVHPSRRPVVHWCHSGALFLIHSRSVWCR